jgi:ribosomal-protein-serine acetyltransferase
MIGRNPVIRNIARARADEASRRGCARLPAMLRCELPGGCRLRPFEESDADELYAVVDANRAHLDQWLPWVRDSSPEHTLEFIRAARKQVTDNDGAQLAIVDDGRIVGTIGFHRVDWANRSTSIGYWIAADRQGRGIVTEAVRALVDHAFGTWKLERVEIRAEPANVRSRAIPQRLGFREEGTLRAVERHRDRSVDHVVYGLLATEWRR